MPALQSTTIGSPWSSVTPGYFAALKIPLLDGRMFTEADSNNAPPVVLVSRSWARHYFPGENVIGQQLIGLYLGQSNLSTSFGAAASIMILLLWVYYSCQVLLLGAEFTRVYSEGTNARARVS